MGSSEGSSGGLLCGARFVAVLGVLPDVSVDRPGFPLSALSCIDPTSGPEHGFENAMDFSQYDAEELRAYPTHRLAFWA